MTSWLSMLRRTQAGLALADIQGAPSPDGVTWTDDPAVFYFGSVHLPHDIQPLPLRSHQDRMTVIKTWFCPLSSHSVSLKSFGRPNGLPDIDARSGEILDRNSRRSFFPLGFGLYRLHNHWVSFSYYTHHATRVTLPSNVLFPLTRPHEGKFPFLILPNSPPSRCSQA